MDKHKYTLREGTTPAVGSKPTGIEVDRVDRILGQR
jgi:hypothetical protein